ncbi:MAG TPA: M13 family metallopeptidase [Bryobacteraceae bacterium]|nr:M13 family metallopeptidase [Bryobacteraceae bacterium]
MRYTLLLSLFAAVAAAQGIPGFTIGNLDKTADPCVDFYQYTCGGWMAKNPVPADQSIWGQANQLIERNRAILQNILEKAASPKPTRTLVEQQIGDFYASCMDEQAIDKLGAAPLKPEMDHINAITAKSGLVAEVARLHLTGVTVLFNFYSSPDAKDSMRMIAQADQGGMGLPDRDYYLKDDAKSVELRKQYVAHVAKMLELLGEPADKAAADADAVMKIETGLAKGALDRVSRRDPQQTYHKLTVHELVSLSPGIDWPKYFAGVGAPPIEDLNVAEPNFFRTLESVLVQTSLEDLKAYMRWHLVHAEASLLSKPFVDENFHFFRQILTGAKELLPRWKRCVTAVDSDLGFALGQKYVEETFGPEGKTRTLKMVQEIEKAMKDDLGTLSWMTAATKAEALVKLRAVANKIGYPDKWRDYSTVKIIRGDAVGNDERATEFEVQRVLGKIGKQVDRTEWFMTPPTVNAYYNPTENNINFPAGILQPPYWDRKLDDAVNYGGVGAVVGHELTHGFDDQGRQFDPQGNLHDWWTPEDAKEFEKRAECFVKEYSSFIAVEDVHLNGKLTLGENTADNGGLRLAFMALMESLKGKPHPKIDGFTPEQRFFLGWGQVWCQNARPEVSRMRAQIDPHSPGKDRVNGVVSNMPEFQKAFACKVGQPMVREPACRVW